MWKKVKFKRGVMSVLLILGLILTNFSSIGASAEESTATDKTALIKPTLKLKVYQQKDKDTRVEIEEHGNITLGEPVTIEASISANLKSGANSGAAESKYIKYGDTATVNMGTGIQLKDGIAKTVELRGKYEHDGKEENVLFGHVTFTAGGNNDIIAKFIFDGDKEVIEKASKMNAAAALTFEISDKTINDLNGSTDIKIIEKNFKVGAVKSSVQLGKKGKFDPNTLTIDWTISVEKKNPQTKVAQSLNEYVLTDNLKDAGTFVKDSFGVYKDEEGTLPIADVPAPEVKDNILTYTFNDKFAGSKVYLKLKTKPFNDYGYGKLVKEVTKTNKVTIKKGEDEKSASADVEIQKNKAQKFPESYGPVEDNGEKWYKVNWKVIFNEENYKLTNVVITDVIKENEFKMKPIFDKAVLKVFNKEGTSATETAIDTEPDGGKYDVKDIEGRVELTLTTKIKADKVPYRTLFSNRASIKWGDKVQDLIEVSKGVEFPTDNAPISKNVVDNEVYKAYSKYSKGNEKFTSYDVTWEIKTKQNKIQDGDSIYDPIIFDQGFINALKDGTKVEDVVKKVVFKDGNDTKTDLFNKDVVITQYLRCYHKYLGLIDKDDNVKVYKVYCEGYGDNGYVGDMIEITGLKAGEEKSVRYKTRIVNPQALLGLSGGDLDTTHGPIMNRAFVVRNKQVIYKAEPWLYYSGRMLKKQALSKEVNEAVRKSKVAPSVESINEIANIVDEKTADKKAAYNKADKSILYRISVNASGVKSLDGYIKDIKLEDILGEDWEFADVVKGKRILVYEGTAKGTADNSINDYASEDEFVEATKLLTEDEVKNLVTVEPDTKTENNVTKKLLRLKFTKLNGPYVVLLKAVIKADAGTKTLNNADGTMENEAKFYIGGSAKTRKLALGFETEMFGKNVSEIKKDIEGNSYLEWNIVYNHEMALADKDLTIMDTLGGNHHFRGQEKDGKFVPTLSDGNYKLEKWDTKESRYISVEDISRHITFENSQKLTLKLPERNTSYKFTYATDLVKDITTSGYSNRAALVAEGRNVLTADKRYEVVDAYAWGIAASSPKIKLIKTNEKGEPLKGVEFVFEDPAGNKTYPATTNADGSIDVANIGGITLEAGKKYIIKEVEVPNGYVKEPVEVALAITQNVAKRFEKEIVAVTGDAVITSEGAVKAVNKKVATFKLHKKDDKGNNLKDIEFNLIKDGKVQRTGKTDKDGIITFENVGYGDYILQETTPLDKYLPLDEYKISVDPYDATKNISVEKIDGVIEVKDGVLEVTNKTKPTGNGGGNPPSGNGGNNPPSGNGGGNPPSGNGGNNPPSDNGGNNPPSGNGGNNPPVNPNPPTPERELPRYTEDNFPNPNDPSSPDEFVAVDEDGTPQGKYIKKKKPNGENEYIKVDEDLTPEGVNPAKNKLPKTGGSDTAVYYVGGAILLMLAGTFVVRRKKYSK